MKEINTAYNMAYRGELGDVDLNTMIHAYDNGYYEINNPDCVKISNHYPELEFGLEDLQLQVPVSNTTWLQARYTPKNYHFIRSPYLSYINQETKELPSYGEGIYNLPPMGKYIALTNYSDNTKNNTFIWEFGKSHEGRVSPNAFSIKLEMYIKNPYTDLFKSQYGISSINDLFNDDLSTIWIPYKKHKEMLSHFIPGEKKCITGVLEVLSDNDLVIQTFHRFPDESVWVRSYDFKSNTWTSWASEIPSFLHSNDLYDKFPHEGDGEVDIERELRDKGYETYEGFSWQERNTKKLHNASYRNEIEVNPDVEFEIEDSYSNNSEWTRSGKLKDLRNTEKELTEKINNKVSLINKNEYPYTTTYPGEVKFALRDDFINNGERYKLSIGLANKYDEFNMNHAYKGSLPFDYLNFYLKYLNQESMTARNNLINKINRFALKTDVIKTGMEKKLKKSNPHFNGRINIVNDTMARNNLVINESDNDHQAMLVEHYSPQEGNKHYRFISVFKESNKRILSFFSNRLMLSHGRTETDQSERILRGVSRPFVYVNGENKGHMIFHRGLANRCVNPLAINRPGQFPRHSGHGLHTKVLIPRYYDLDEEPKRNPYPIRILLRFKDTNSEFYHDVPIIPGEYTNGRALIPLEVIPHNDGNNFKIVSEKVAGVFIDYRREDDNFDSITFYGTNYLIEPITRGLGMEVLIQE